VSNDYHEDWRARLVRAAEVWASVAEVGQTYGDHAIPCDDMDPAVRGAALRGLHARGLAVEPVAEGRGWLLVSTREEII
jgi:hypothetical protein